MRLSIILLSLFLVFNALAKKVTITMGYPEFPPYTYTKDLKPAGIGVDKLQEITKNSNINIKFEPVDTYGSGMNFLRNNKIDGLFLASQNRERDDLAEFSHPIGTNNWVWVSRKNKSVEFNTELAKSSLRIATYKNANTHIWLQKNRYELVYPTTDVSAMIRQLMNLRVDTIFLAEEVFNKALKNSQWRKSDVNITIEITKPMGLYISKFFLRKHPDFMKQLNLQIDTLSR
jgi:ABC-type amino acid transport substrate-binding protein